MCGDLKLVKVSLSHVVLLVAEIHVVYIVMCNFTYSYIKKAFNPKKFPCFNLVKSPKGALPPRHPPSMTDLMGWGMEERPLPE